MQFKYHKKNALLYKPFKQNRLDASVARLLHETGRLIKN